MGKYKPGKGWVRLNDSVCKHEDGQRIHVAGIIRLSDGTIVSANTWPESEHVNRFVRINGGNRKRGLMAWARSLDKES